MTTNFSYKEDFIYCSTPSFTLFENEHFQDFDAVALSADGRIIVGSLKNDYNEIMYKGCWWTQETGIQFLGSLNGGNRSTAEAVSADGQRIVGWAADGNDNNSMKAVKWTQGPNIQSLGTLNGGNYSYAMVLNADGRVIGGFADDGKQNNKPTAFIWTAATGMQSFHSVLTSLVKNEWGRDLILSSFPSVNANCCVFSGMAHDQKFTKVSLWHAVLPFDNDF